MCTKSIIENTKNIKGILFPVFLFIMISCSDDSTKEKENSAKTPVSDSSSARKEFDSSFLCTGMSNLIIDSAKADSMRKLFKEHYRKEYSTNPVNNLVESVWVDSCVVTAFSNFFETNNDFDGVRFYFGAYGSDKSTIMLIPTKAGDGTTWPIGRHEDMNSTQIPIKLNCNKEFKNFNMAFQSFIKMKNKFGGTYRHERIPGRRTTALLDSLSLSVWMGRCVFKALSELLKANSGTLDGVNVYFGAYDKLENSTHPGQHYKYQSTILVVATEPLAGGHRDNWNIIKSSPFFMKYLDFGGYNHGELCPDVCN